MKHFCASGLGRVVILELDRGEKVIESIESTLKKEGIKNAYIASAVGSIQHLKYHRPLTLATMAEDEFLSLSEPFEIGNIGGTVIDGVAHLHISAGSPQGVQVGHLEKGTEVLYLVEIVLVEILGVELERVLTPEKVKKLFPKGE